LFTEVDTELRGAYMNAYLLRGIKYYDQGQYQKALDDFLAVIEYPENLEVEIPNPKRDRASCRNFYYIATAYEALGDAIKAKEFYEKSSNVNVRNSEYGYYKGMAFKKLGKDSQAQQAFDSLIEVANNIDTVDFFAKFGQSTGDISRKAQPYYLKGLAYMGMGKIDQAKEQLQKASEIDGNNVWAAFYLEQLK
jgi:tetratricopeptide (TPR) repeat protein